MKSLLIGMWTQISNYDIFKIKIFYYAILLIESGKNQIFELMKTFDLYFELEYIVRRFYISVIRYQFKGDEFYFPSYILYQ